MQPCMQPAAGCRITQVEPAAQRLAERCSMQDLVQNSPGEAKYQLDSMYKPRLAPRLANAHVRQRADFRDLPFLDSFVTRVGTLQVGASPACCTCSWCERVGPAILDRCHTRAAVGQQRADQPCLQRAQGHS